MGLAALRFKGVDQLLGGSAATDLGVVGQRARVGDSGLPRGPSLAEQPAAEVVEAVVGAAAVDQGGGPPQVPAVGLGHELAVDAVPGQHVVDRPRAQRRDQLAALGLTVPAGGLLGGLDQRPELLAVHGGLPVVCGTAMGMIHQRWDTSWPALRVATVKPLLRNKLAPGAAFGGGLTDGQLLSPRGLTSPRARGLPFLQVLTDRRLRRSLPPKARVAPLGGLLPPDPPPWPARRSRPARCR
jgi:hypothetical protein